VKLECRGLCKSFGDDAAAVSVLEGVGFDLADREILCVVGPSGCGKSTLLKILAGLLEADSGRVVAHDGDGSRNPANALVFQDHGLFPWMNVLDNVAFGLRMAGVDRRESAARAGEQIARMGLERFARRHPHELSVGMRQRVNLARALLVDPQVLLLDEPFAALDAQSRLVLQEELLVSVERSGKSIVYVTHDIEDAVLMGDRVLVLSGRPARVRDEIAVPLPRPRDLEERGDPRVAALVRRIWNQLETEVRKGLEAAP
jgi:NitT/TauT family transport system ATP-binding protein